MDVLPLVGFKPLPEELEELHSSESFISLSVSLFSFCGLTFFAEILDAIGFLVLWELFKYSG